MSDIYQKIWDADQSEAGVQPILDTQPGDSSQGFVMVSSELDERHQELRVLPEAVIPQRKMHTYELCRVLFDNYALAERAEEIETPEEREEVHELVHAMVDTAPMQVAREYVAEATGRSVTRERWYNTVLEMWFRRFSQGGDPHLTGFEHVVVGEQEGSKAQGYHFWYKYYLDDGFAREVDGTADHFPGLVNDRIAYLGSKLAAGQAQFPETVTISYRWHAPDYDAQKLRPLTKPIGGFFVGCSVEGLLALGTVRAHTGARAPKEGEINGARYALKVFRSSNNRHVRTFYPMFLGAADGGSGGGDEHPVVPPARAAHVRIIAALVNPEGHDPGRESVTLLNTGPSLERLDGWRLEDRNGRAQSLSGMDIGAGDALRITLDRAGAQLSNKGGKIKLVGPHGDVAQTVTYSKGQVKQDGNTIVF